MTKDYRIYVKDILEAIASIEKFVQNMDFVIFVNDDKTTSAVIRKFEIIGEAAKQIPDNIKAKHITIPWKAMAGMRDKLIHFYAGVDHNLVWETIQTKLPELKKALQQLP